MARNPGSRISLSNRSLRRLSNAWRFDWFEFYPMLEEGKRLLVGG
jgi:hypothetical protein